MDHVWIKPHHCSAVRNRLRKRVSSLGLAMRQELAGPLRRPCLGPGSMRVPPSHAGCYRRALGPGQACEQAVTSARQARSRDLWPLLSTKSFCILVCIDKNIQEKQPTPWKCSFLQRTLKSPWCQDKPIACVMGRLLLWLFPLNTEKMCLILKHIHLQIVRESATKRPHKLFQPSTEVCVVFFFFKA